VKREDFVQHVKDCGQSIIDNAEKIINDFQYSCNGVRIEIQIDSESVPTISVIKNFYPEMFIENIRNQRI
jgi:hypothetical protein